MPNGGMLPSCWICQWATRTDGINSPIYCQRHKMTVFSPTHTFCPDLSLPGSPGIASFLARVSPEPEMVYTWLEFSYRDPRNPTLPMYHHEQAILAPIEVYSTWDEAQIRQTTQSICEQKLKELQSQKPDQ